MTIFYTKKGDCGKSVLGKRMIAKDNPVFGVLGKFDEVNSLVGWCRAGAKSKIKNQKSKLADITKTLLQIQQDLFIAQSELAAGAIGAKPKAHITAARTAKLEKIIDEIGAEIPVIKNFVIPGESELSARLDIARASARSAERALVLASRSFIQRRGPTITPDTLQYFNRLSSVLFALARLANFLLKKSEQNPSYQ